MNNQNSHLKADIASILLLGAGIVLIILAGLYNEYVAAFLDPNPPLSDITAVKIRSAQFYFIFTGCVLISISGLVRKVRWLRTVMGKPLFTNMLLCFLTIFLVIFILELTLRPFADLHDSRKTTIFMRDSELGWRLKPNSEDIWGGVRVKINGKGLRGPELDFRKSPNVLRILYLGDSVTFGYMLESYEQTFPFLVETILEKKSKKKIETINAGVGGYSPWQEYLYLSREGIKYSPNLIVISFVLNDVTEKFRLKRFGGWDEGHQLSRTLSLSDKSSIFWFARWIGARIRFGSNIQEEAINREILDVKTLVNHPTHPNVKSAWKITLENLTKIFSFCRERDIPVILIIFPYAFQFDDVRDYSTPQMILAKHAINNKIPVIDLLPVLSQKMKEQGMRPQDYFLDRDHLSPLGCEVAAEIIADFIIKERVLTN